DAGILRGLLADDEAAARGERVCCGVAVGLDSAAMLEVARTLLHTARFPTGADGQVGRRSGDEIEDVLEARVPEVAGVDAAAIADAVPCDRSPREIDAERLRLDADETRRRESPGEEQQDAADSATEVEDAARPVRDVGRDPRGREVVERPALS